jgi:hypothetical protein
MCLLAATLRAVLECRATVPVIRYIRCGGVERPLPNIWTSGELICEPSCTHMHDTDVESWWSLSRVDHGRMGRLRGWPWRPAG